MDECKTYGEETAEALRTILIRLQGCPSVIDAVGLGESVIASQSSIADLFAELSNPGEIKEPTIPQLKKMLKYSKNPLERKQLERKINIAYKERRMRK